MKNKIFIYILNLAVLLVSFFFFLLFFIFTNSFINSSDVYGLTFIIFYLVYFTSFLLYSLFNFIKPHLYSLFPFLIFTLGFIFTHLIFVSYYFDLVYLFYISSSLASALFLVSCLFLLVKEYIYKIKINKV